MLKRPRSGEEQVEKRLKSLEDDSKLDQIVNGFDLILDRISVLDDRLNHFDKIFKIRMGKVEETQSTISKHLIFHHNTTVQKVVRPLDEMKNCSNNMIKVFERYADGLEVKYEKDIRILLQSLVQNMKNYTRVTDVNLEKVIQELYETHYEELYKIFHIMKNVVSKDIEDSISPISVVDPESTMYGQYLDWKSKSRNTWA